MGRHLERRPQGGIASPVLSNIYLHKLDVFVETVLIPERPRDKRSSSVSRRGAYWPSCSAESSWPPAGPGEGQVAARCEQLAKLEAERGPNYWLLANQ